MAGLHFLKKENVMEKILLVAALLLTPMLSSAATITNGANANTYQVQSNEAIGQSFTAIDANVEAGLYFTGVNTFLPNSDAIRYSLYDGQGSAGSLLSQATFNLADGFEGFKMIDFTSVTLTIGNIYTLLADVVGSSAYWGMRDGSSYDGGTAYRSGIAASGDMRFNVTGVPEVPVPAALFLFAPALLGFMGLRRRAKNLAA
jgi:hypothetical protein